MFFPLFALDRATAAICEQRVEIRRTVRLASDTMTFLRSAMNKRTSQRVPFRPTTFLRLPSLVSIAFPIIRVYLVFVFFNSSTKR